MTYRRNIAILGGAAAALALIFAASVVFAPENRARSASTAVLLAAKRAAAAVRIELREAGGVPWVLEKTGETWSAAAGGFRLPVQSSRVEDLFAALSAKAEYPQRAASEGAQASLGLTDAAAGGIKLTDSAGAVLLDLLVGQADPSGRAVYLRRAGDKRIFSGPDSFASLLSGGPRAWYRLELFGADPAVRAEAIQGLELSAPSVPALALARTADGWTVNGAAADKAKADAWAASVAGLLSDDISTEPLPASAEDYAKLTVELGDGTSRRILVQEAAAGEGRRYAAIEGLPYRFVLGQWAVARLMKTAADFAPTAAAQ
jgi:hypothetical protein